MPSRTDRSTQRLAALAVLLILAACGGGKRPPVLATTPGGEASPAEGGGRAPVQPLDEGPDVRAVEGDRAQGADLSDWPAEVSGEGGPLADVRFEYDSASLTDRSAAEAGCRWAQPG